MTKETGFLFPTAVLFQHASAKETNRKKIGKKTNSIAKTISRFAITNEL